MVKKYGLIYMNCHKCIHLYYDYRVTENDKTFLYKCMLNGKNELNTKKLKCDENDYKTIHC